MPVSLVVDDEPSVRRYISTILQREHFDTLEAENGTRAFQIVQELRGGVDLIVSDIQMPEGDGLALAEAVKNSYPALPIILTSGYAEPDTAIEFLPKPFSPAALMKAVRRVHTPGASSLVESGIAP